MQEQVTTVRITGRGSDVDSVVANLREKLDEQLGVDAWALCDCGDCQPVWIDMELSPGGTAASVEVTLTVRGDRLSTATLPRELHA